MDDLPLELVMLFQSTACLCAYDSAPNDYIGVMDNQATEDVDATEDDEQSDSTNISIGSSSVGCCMGDRAHIQIYESMGLLGADRMTEEQEAYTRLFCTEAYYFLDSILGGVADETGAPSYASSNVPSYAPSSAPSTETPTSDSPTSMAPSSAMPTSLAPSAAATTPTTSLVPTATITEVTTGEPTIVSTTYEPTPMETSVITTIEPTATEAAADTNEPTPVASSDEPTAVEAAVDTNEPTSAATTNEPTVVDNITTTSEPTPVPTVEPTPAMTTLSPTTSREIGTAPPVSPPITPTPTVIEIEIQYGITSDCGVTAEDVLTGKDGITIQGGLIAATETLLIDILNSTYPSGEEVVPTAAPSTANGGMESTTESPTFAVTEEDMVVTASPTVAGTEDVVTFSPTAGLTEDAATASPTTTATEGMGDGGGSPSPSSVATGDSTAAPTVTGSTGVTGSGATPSPSAAKSPTTLAPTIASPLEMRNASIHAKIHGARFRINHLSSKPLSRRSLLSMLEDESPSLFRLHNSRLRQQNPHHLQHQKNHEHRQSRSMVYYTRENPVVINDITDVTDETCPSELTCMKVDSTLFVTLEEGVDAEEVAIQSVVKNGFEASFQDFSFFNVSSIFLFSACP